MHTLLALAIIALSAAPPAERVKVFVTSATNEQGFTDPSKDKSDTVKDLKNALKDKGSVQLTDNKDDATIVLTVLDRKTAGLTAGFLGGAARDREIHVKFTCGTFETDMSASAQGGVMGSGGSWGKAARKIAKQVDEWVVANRAKLSAR